MSAIISQGRKLLKREKEEAAARIREFQEKLQRQREEEALRRRLLRSQEEENNLIFSSQSASFSNTDDSTYSSEWKAPDVTSCGDCGETMKSSQLSVHKRERCFKRKVLCPNRQFGCTGEGKRPLDDCEHKFEFVWSLDTEGIPLDELQEHLKNNCKAEIWRDELISRSKLRKEPMQCILCGQMIPMEDLRIHEVVRIRKSYPCWIVISFLSTVRRMRK